MVLGKGVVYYEQSNPVTRADLHRCRTNMAQIRQSRSDSGLDSQVKVLIPLHFVLFSLGSGRTMTKAAGFAREQLEMVNCIENYRGTSLIRSSAPLGPYSRNMPRALWWS